MQVAIVDVLHVFFLACMYIYFSTAGSYVKRDFDGTWCETSFGGEEEKVCSVRKACNR